jgi:hypothetical protein
MMIGIADKAMHKATIRLTPWIKVKLKMLMPLEANKVAPHLHPRHSHDTHVFEKLQTGHGVYQHQRLVLYLSCDALWRGCEGESP